MAIKNCFTTGKMTKEIRDILNAYKIASKEGRQSALATVVYVEGSSYRRPGARMLVEDNGKMTGAISGGCLEGDAYRKAMLVMMQQQNKLVTYNSMESESDLSFGVQLGCNGIVHILFEPIDPAKPNNPVDLLEAICEKRRDAVLVTLFSLENFYGTQPGTCFFCDNETSKGNIEDKMLGDLIATDAKSAICQKSSLVKQYDDQNLTGFIELIQPPVSLVIAGAGNDALPLVELATVLGWQVTIVDGRPAHASKQRFPNAHSIIVEKPEFVFKQLTIDDNTAFVLMTHNYNYDLAGLRALLQSACRYIGILGPKRKLQRMLSELQEQGIVISKDQMKLIYGPTGLDIGAETPEEIALSMLAEIKAVMSGHNGESLRDKPASIHSRETLLKNEVPIYIHNILK